VRRSQSCATHGEDLFSLSLRDEQEEPAGVARQIADVYQSVQVPQRGHHA